MMSSSRRLLAWNELDLGPQWVRRHAPLPAAAVQSEALQEPDPEHSVSDPGGVGDTWQQLAGEVAGCARCGLSETRRHTVFGSGPPAARWLLVGEAPDAEEDGSGEIFAGQPGQLLDQMLVAIGLSRQEVFITNLLKCRPPGDRAPSPVEADACSGYLYRQIDLLQPDLILLLGEAAAQSVLQTPAGLAQLRGQVHRCAGAHGEIPVICTFHPDYLLRNPADKRRSWEDLCLAVDVAARQQSLRTAAAAGG